MWLILHYLMPGLAPDPAPFVIISMLAFFGAAAKAPIAVMFMVIEMTGSYQLLPGAMIAVAIAYLVSGDYTIYRAQVPTRRDSPAHAGEYRVPLLMEIRLVSAGWLMSRSPTLMRVRPQHSTGCLGIGSRYCLSLIMRQVRGRNKPL